MLTQITGPKLESIKNLLLTQNEINPIVAAMVKKVTPVSDLKIIRKTELKSYLYYIGKSTDTDAAILKNRPLRFVKTQIDALEAQLSESLPATSTARHSFVLTEHVKKQAGGTPLSLTEDDKLFIVSAGGDNKHRRFLLRNHRNATVSDVVDAIEKRLTTTAVNVATVAPNNITIPLGTAQEIKVALAELIDPEGELLFPEDIILSTTDFKEGYGYTAKISDLSLVYEGSLSFKVGPVTEGEDEEEEPTNPEDGGETNPPAEVVKEKITAERLVYNDQLLDTVIYSTAKQILGLNEGEEIQSVVAKDETGVTTASFGYISNFSPDESQVSMVRLAKTTVNPYLVVTTTERVINIDLTDLSASPPSGSFSQTESYILDVVGTSFEEVGIPDNSVYVIKSPAVTETLTSTEPDYNVALRDFMETHFAEDIMIDESDPAVATNMSETNIEFEIFLESGELVTVVTLTPGLE